MSKFTYNGASRSVRVAGVLFENGVETELDAEQAKTFKADYFGKAFLDDGSIIESKSKNDDSTKPLSKMKVEDLQTYIIENGGEFAESDNKPELLVIAQAIEDDKNDKG